MNEKKLTITFTERHQRGLHCRFCNETKSSQLCETSPVRGIVCLHCMAHLSDYLNELEIEVKSSESPDREEVRR